MLLLSLKLYELGTSLKGAPVSSSQGLIRSGMVGLGAKVCGCGTRAREVASEDWLHERVEDNLGPAFEELAWSASYGDRPLTQIEGEQATG